MLIRLRSCGTPPARKNLVNGAGNAIEHLIDHAIDAAIAGVLHRNAGRLRIGQRQAGIVEALIGETRAGVIPRADAVGAGKPSGVVAVIRRIARLGDEKGAAAEAEDSPGWKRNRLI